MCLTAPISNTSVHEFSASITPHAPQKAERAQPLPGRPSRSRSALSPRYHGLEADACRPSGDRAGRAQRPETDARAVVQVADLAVIARRARASGLRPSAMTFRCAAGCRRGPGRALCCRCPAREAWVADRLQSLWNARVSRGTPSPLSDERGIKGSSMRGLRPFRYLPLADVS